MTTELTKAAQQALEVLKSATIFMSKKARDQHPKTVARLERALTQRPAAQTEEQTLVALAQRMAADGLIDDLSLPTETCRELSWHSHTRHGYWTGFTFDSDGKVIETGAGC